MTVDLILLGNDTAPAQWLCGDIHRVEAAPAALADFVERHLEQTNAEAWLFWNPVCGVPDSEQVAQLLESPADIWHAGLKLGASGLPRIIDFVTPTWMLNRDPDPAIEATSWRMSFDACLVRTEVFRQLGGPGREFRTLLGAGLEFGHRCITRGALIRHIPSLVASRVTAGNYRLPSEDETEFLIQRFGGWQPYWGLFRAVMTRLLPLRKAFAGVRCARSAPQHPRRAIYTRQKRTTASTVSGHVTVLIPTLYRYPYLRTVLDQLRRQTIAPLEIIVVDQTDVSERDTTLAADFADLPLKIFYLDEAGQCTSRNLGLQHASGEYILFIDDDDEIPSTLIELHLAQIRQFQVSSGVAEEVGAGALPENFTFFRSSDVFPTNNTLIRKEVLLKSGLFDLAYDRGQRADGDLGMRVYLSGALMVLDPAISVLHHHAPQGGLREHKARVITYASSRNSLTQRQLPSASEVYLGLRYFTPRQVSESLWMRALGTLSARGSWRKKLVKLVIGAALLPNTIFRIRQVYQAGQSCLRDFPIIPALGADRDI